MRLAVDSSALAKRYIQEAGSDKLASLLLNASELALCIIVVPEIVSGLNRRMREGFLTVADYRAAKRQLLGDVRDATILQITPAVVSRSLRLLENGNLRAMDTLHVACALEWRSDLFVTSDSRQSLAAGNAGLRTEYLGNG